jgi:hypothetical protein
MALEHATRALPPAGTLSFAWRPIVGTAHAAEAAAHLEAGRLEAALASLGAVLAATEGARSPDLALARARALTLQGQVLAASKADPRQAFTDALLLLRGVHPALAPSLQAELECRLAAQSRDCGDAATCQRSAAKLEEGSAVWAVGNLAPAKLVKGCAEKR